jgi:hypothetical protein
LNGFDAQTFRIVMHHRTSIIISETVTPISYSNKKGDELAYVIYINESIHKHKERERTASQ